MNAPIRTHVEYVAHSAAAPYEIKTLGEDSHALEEVEKTLRLLDAQLYKLAACAASERARVACHGLGLALFDCRHEAAWPGLLVAAQEAAVEANVKPMLTVSS